MLPAAWNGGRKAHHPMKNYYIVLVANSLVFGVAGIMMPLLTLYLAGLGADLALISVILTSSYVVVLGGTFAWGWLADRTGRRKPFFVGGLLLSALAYLWLSRSSTVAAAWPARLLDGLGLAAVATLGLTLVGDILDASTHKGRSIGLFRGIGSLTWALGALAGGWIADAFSFQAAFLLCAAVMFAAVLVALLLQEVKVTAPPVASPAVAPGPAAPVPAAPVPAARQARSLPPLFLIGVATWTAVDYASSSMWPNYLASLGYSTAAISGFWSLAALFEMPAMVLFGSLSDIIGRAIVLAAGGFSIALVQVGYVLFVQSLPALLSIQVVRGLGLGSYTAGAMTYAAEQGSPERRGSSSGLFFAISSTGQLAGTLMGGTVAQAFGFTTLYLICALLATCAGACFLALRRSESHPHRLAAT
jgi:MFS family permease